MGIAAYNRGSLALTRQIDAEAPPVEFEVMDNLNALPKFVDAGHAFGPIRFVFGNGGFWAECPTTGKGFWYPTLREAVSRWRVTITRYEYGAWLADPIPRS